MNAMVIGRVYSSGRVDIPIQVEGPGGVHEVDALLDTGFNGTLALPENRIAALKLTRQGLTSMTLADGNRRDVSTYRGHVHFAKETYSALVVPAAEPLLGMALFWGATIQIQCESQGNVVLV